MKKAFGFLAASLAISLATSAVAQDAVTDVNSKVVTTPVSTAQLPKTEVLAKFEASKENAIESKKTEREERRMEKKQAVEQRKMDRKQFKEDRIADRRHQEVKARVMDFKQNHPEVAHTVVNHRTWFQNHGVSPVNVLSNPDKFRSFRNRMVDRHGK